MSEPPPPAPRPVRQSESSYRDTEPSRNSVVDGVAVTAEARTGYLPRGAQVGRYFVVGFVGEGGMATVYSAFDPELSRKVAIKILKFVGGDLDAARKQLHREAKAMARLSHPNVVPVYDAGTFEGQVFVAMELVEGRTLRAWLDEQPRKRHEVLEAFREAGEGLAAAHRAGLVHRDFKPENVLVGGDGRVRVSDFGLARIDGDSLSGSRPGASLGLGLAPKPDRDAHETYTGSLTGTPAYMAPEQLLGQVTDHRTDQFSFCAALWESLTGELPYGDGDFTDIRRAVVGGVLKTPKRDMPRWLHRALAKGLAVKPDDRHPSLPVLLAILDKRPERQLRRLAAPAFLALAVAAIGAVGAWQWRLEATACSREAADAARVLWGDRREGLAQALAATPGVQAADVLRQLDERIGQWKGLQTAACEDQRHARASAPVVLECLERYRVTAQVTIETLAVPGGAGDAGKVLLDRLSPPDQCSAMKAPPAKHLADVDLRKQAAQIRARALMGQHAVAIEQATALLPAAREKGALEVVSMLEELVGSALGASQGPKPEVLEWLRKAVRDADGSGHDEQSLRARLALASSLAERFERTAEAEEVSLDAQAWLARLGTPPHLELAHVSSRAMLLSFANRQDESLALYQRALELLEKTSPTANERGEAYNNLGIQLMIMGRYAESEKALERAFELYKGAPWRSPLDMVTSIGNIGILKAELGKTSEALQLLDQAESMVGQLKEEAVSIRVWLDARRAQVLEDLGRAPEAFKVYRALLEKPDELDPKLKTIAQTGEARALVAEGRFGDAIKVAQGAVPLSTDQQAKAQARLALADALWADGKDRPRAVEEAREALKAYQGPEDVFRRGQIQKWLAAHELPK